jgi:ParB family chromosome partitioning protein
LRYIPIEQIERFDLRLSQREEDIEDISATLEKHGQLSPIRVRVHPTKPGKYQVVFGNRRLVAATRLGWKSIRAEVVDSSDADLLIAAFCENASRKDFSDYEKALLIERIRNETGKTYTEIAAMLGKSVAYVSQRVAMLHLFSKSVASQAEMLRVLSALTEKHARALTKIEDPQDHWNTAKLCIKANMGVRELDRICNRSDRRKESAHSYHHVKEIQTIVQRMIEGFNSKDLSPFFSLVSEKRFTNFPLFPPFEKVDGEQAKEHFCSALGQIDKLEESIQDSEVRVVGKFAYAILQIKSRLVIAGRHISTRSRATLLFEREGDAWKLVHAHWSSPIAPQLPELVVSSRNSRPRRPVAFEFH